MKKIIITLSVLFVASLLYAQTIESKIIGNWFCVEMDKSTINVYKAADGFYYAKITESEVKTNVGKTILTKAKYNKTENTFTGTMTRPSNGMEINSTIYMENDNRVKVVGKKFIITKTFYWTKI